MIRALAWAALGRIAGGQQAWEPCDVDVCTCAGFCLEGLSERTHTLRSASDNGTRFLLSLCTELPKDHGYSTPPSAPDGWQPGSQGCAGCDADAEECTVVRITTGEGRGGQDSVVCDGAGTIGGCQYPEPCGMSGRKTADGGLDIRYQFAASAGKVWIQDDFVIHISAGQQQEEYTSVTRQLVDGEYQYSANLTAPAEDFTCLSPEPEPEPSPPPEPEPEPSPPPSPPCSCAAPPAASAHTDLRCTKEDGASAPLDAPLPCGASCTFTCAAGYVDPDVGRARTFDCTAGNFTNHDLNCVLEPPPPPPPCTCGAAPPGPTHARTNCFQAQVPCGTTCTFTCDDHYSDPAVGDSTTFTCGPDGNFTSHDLHCEAEPEPQPEPEPEAELCTDSYRAVIESVTKSGPCVSRVACTPDDPPGGCQSQINTMLAACKDQVYNTTDPETGSTMTRAFDQQASEALQKLGLGHCDFHEGYESCDSTCTIPYAIKTLGTCAKWFMSFDFQGFCKPNGGDPASVGCDNLGPEGGCSAECMDKFFDFQDRCTYCEDPIVQNFLRKASSGTLGTRVTDFCDHPPCLGAATCMTGCDNITDRVLRTCCSTQSNECDQNNCASHSNEKDCLAAAGCTCEGAEESNNGDPSKCQTPIKCVAEDPWPPTCSDVGGCAEAVVSAALDVCPEKFYVEPRLFGLYADCTEGRQETNEMLKDA
eukprot:COSAG02_NODE_9230_length_2283_cov_1.328297_1_plen_702_part_10